MRERRAMFSMLAAAVLAACTAPPVLEQLDARAGMMLRRASTPLVFARTDARYSRSTRDYLYIAPLETNRQGVREYYLWVGVATTLDRGFLAPPADQPSVLYATVEGEPIELPLRPFEELVRLTSDEPAYATAVPLRAELAARVTLQQLELLGEAALDSLAVAADARAPQTFVRWRPGDFEDFLSAAGR